MNGMSDLPRLIAGDEVAEELFRIAKAYLCKHDMPTTGQRLNVELCNRAID